MTFLSYVTPLSVAPRLLPLWQGDGTELKFSRIHLAGIAVAYPEVTVFLF